MLIRVLDANDNLVADCAIFGGERPTTLIGNQANAALIVRAA